MTKLEAQGLMTTEQWGGFLRYAKEHPDAIFEGQVGEYSVQEFLKSWEETHASA